MRTSMIAGTLLVGLLAGAPVMRGDDAKTPMPQTVDGNELQRMVQAEVQRQLPPLVKAEVKRQIDTLMAQAQVEAREHSKLNSAASTMQTLRGQLELYKIQHRDAYPSMSDLADWKVFVKATDAQGHVTGQTPFGPYIQRAPINVYTLSASMAAAGTATVKDGWTWDEKNACMRIVLPAGEKDAIQFFGSDAEVVQGAPEPVPAAKAAMMARQNAASSTLQTMRGQLELYKIQHQDKTPTWAQMAGWSVLAHGTDVNGNAGTKFGPYIRSAPSNPFNGKSTIAPAGTATAETGWTYNETGGEFRIVVTAEEAKNATPLLDKNDFEVGK